jgi:hypothetical protein
MPPITELMSLLMAAQEPPSIALTWILDRLAREPEPAADFVAEPRGKRADAVVREVLRLRPGAGEPALAGRAAVSGVAESRQGLLGTVKDEAVAGEPGHREHPQYLVGRRVDDEFVAHFLHPVMGAEDDRDPGGVDEGAALQTDQHLAALGDRGGEDFVELAGDREVELAFDLDLPSTWSQVTGAHFEGLHHHRSFSGYLGMVDLGVREISTRVRKTACRPNPCAPL